MRNDCTDCCGGACLERVPASSRACPATMARASRRLSIRASLLALLLAAGPRAALGGGVAAPCAAPLGAAAFRLGEGPAAHVKRMGAGARWQDANAVDFLAPEGTPVHAVADGAVCAPPACVFGKTEEEKRDKNSLNTFTLLGPGGLQFYYTHAGSILVKPGQSVSRGQQVATVGAYAGKNAHLHLAVNQGSACDVLKTCSPSDARGCG
ncbi:hypothetical protein Rsub_06952 [Raphidocelis subcapitata]|uniref:M23ase beta-sheet core domain-containing protein n=1 Tax=Raphidocelis subcapitata TaxID=307507 RepID=A0A2V0P8Z5_9CHLO|nr:hypothetical protein Rsub_06952 [Raphidocelis subcapitata]|eukprot:GBF94330.1 hypothetical protein Rsub_06952 [Raphidocelis subcapitata]